MLDLIPRSVLAILRAAMITAGVLTALLMNTFVFPKHCRVSNAINRSEETVVSLTSPRRHSDVIHAKCEPYSRFVESAVPDALQACFMCHLDGHF